MSDRQVSDSQVQKPRGRNTTQRGLSPTVQSLFFVQPPCGPASTGKQGASGSIARGGHAGAVARWIAGGRLEVSSAPEPSVGGPAASLPRTGTPVIACLPHAPKTKVVINRTTAERMGVTSIPGLVVHRPGRCEGNCARGSCTIWRSGHASSGSHALSERYCFQIFGLRDVAFVEAIVACLIAAEDHDGVADRVVGAEDSQRSSGRLAAQLPERVLRPLDGRAVGVAEGHAVYSAISILILRYITHLLY